MSYSSCLRQPENDHYLQIHAWQIRFCQDNRCAALLMAFFASWHDWKLKNDCYYQKANNIAEMHGDGRPHNENAYLFFSTEQLIEGCLGFYGKKAIQEALNLLVSLQVISIHQNPNPRYHFDKTKYFKFYPEVCNRWLDQACQKEEKPQYETQVLDYLDQPKMDDPSSQNGVLSGENGLPSGEKARYITNKTNNTTNKNKSINTRGDFFENEKPKAEIEPEAGSGEVIQTISKVLAAKGFQSEAFHYPDSIEAIQQLLDQGASLEHFEQAYELCEHITRKRGKGFGLNYLIKAVSSQMKSVKNAKTNYSRPVSTAPPDPPPETRYENDFSKGLHWMGDLLEENDDELTTKN